jgi:hypothetical protein
MRKTFRKLKAGHKLKAGYKLKTRRQKGGKVYSEPYARDSPSFIPPVYSHLYGRPPTQISTMPGYSHLTSNNPHVYGTATSPDIDEDEYQNPEVNLNNIYDEIDDPDVNVNLNAYDLYDPGPKPNIDDIEIGSRIVFDKNIKTNMEKNNCLALDSELDYPNIRSYKQYWNVQIPELLVKGIREDDIIVTNLNANKLKANRTTGDALKKFSIKKQCLNEKRFTVIPPVVGGKRRTKRSRTKRSRTKRSRTKRSRTKRSRTKRK